MDLPSCIPPVSQINLKIFRKSDDRDGMKLFEGMQSHLRGHNLCHFGNVYGNYSDAVCRRVRQVVCGIVHCFLKAMVYLVSHIQFLLVTAIMELQPDGITASRVRASAKPEDIKVDIFRLLSTGVDEDDERRCFRRL